MMLFLGMDTSTSFGGIALTAPEKVLAECALNISRTHVERLLPAIRRMLAQAEVKLAEVGALAVTTGPGSFTGLRIGLATAKTLALTTAKPLVGIPTLDVLAANVACAPGLTCAILDARRGEVYAAFYRRDLRGETTRVTEVLALTPEELAGRIQEPVLLVGDGVRTYGEKLRRESPLHVMLAPLECHVPRAAVLCRLAREKLGREGGVRPADLQALYVRSSDAERHRKAAGPEAPV